MSHVSAYQRTTVIGQGKFGVVYKGYHKKTKKVVAIKVLELDTKYDEVVDVQQEIQFLADLKHTPNVTHYYGSFLEDTKLWIIMDYCAGGSLRTLLKPGVLEEKYIGVIVREVLIGLQAVHKLGVIHRDLKAANILVTNEGQVQLCDFGVATQLTANSSKRTTIAGTPFWMAPEVIREGDHYNVKADIWSLGITTYEFATGNPPYCDKGASWAMTMIEKQAPPRLEGREYPSALKEFVALCLDENPQERPSAEDLLKCKLVKQYKSVSTLTLKELISRYLHWRDNNASSRNSVFVNPDADQSSEDEQLDVKWDFDSLSSREFIVSNDVHQDDDDNQLLSSQLDDFGSTINDETWNYNAPTSSGMNDTITNINTSSLTEANFSRSADHLSSRTPKTATTKTPTTKSSSGTMKNQASNPAVVPKSLISLFEEVDSSPESSPFPSVRGQFEGPPRIPNMTAAETLGMKSPTIEIPDMESLSKITPASKDPRSHQSPTNTMPRLNRAPTLASASSSGLASLESGQVSPTAPSRQRKKTISNSMNSHASSAPFADHAAPRTPPVITDHQSRRETPSPVPPFAAPFADGSLTSSPSKSMRALHANNNPMLQPINFKLNSDSAINKHPGQPSGTGLSAPFSSTTAPSQLGALANSGVSASTPTLHNVGFSEAKKEKPSLRIQMPVPSSSVNILSSLINDESESKGENVNQFGINPALIGNVTSMTPVAEKDTQLGDEARDRPTENIITQRAIAPKKAQFVSSGPKSAPINGSFNIAPKIPLVRNNSTLSRPSSARKTVEFPAVPPLNGELFSDSTPKAKIIKELEDMMSLFSVGLASLEASLTQDQPDSLRSARP